MRSSQAAGRNDAAQQSKGQRRSLRAVAAADSALAFIRRAPPTRILHVFRQVCNLTDSGGNILSLTLDPLQMTSFSIALDHPGWLDDFLHHFDADSRVALLPGRIELGAVDIQVAAPARWISRPDWGLIRSGAARSRGRLDEVGAILRRHADPESLAAVHSLRVGQEDEAGRRWWEAAVDPLQAILRGLRSRDQDVMQRAAGRLAGLGPGLTPAGDDFMVGIMHAIWSFMNPSEARELCACLSETASPRTNVFSAAHLRAAARGEAAAPWQALLTILSDPGSDGLVPAVDVLLAQGHTSGQDALSGFLLGAGLLVAEIPEGSDSPAPDVPRGVRAD